MYGVLCPKGHKMTLVVAIQNLTFFIKTLPLQVFLLLLCSRFKFQYSYLLFETHCPQYKKQKKF